MADIGTALDTVVATFGAIVTDGREVLTDAVVLLLPIDAVVVAVMVVCDGTACK